ncbi:MAG: hypothetical protein GC151_07745 [Betaproteobacteria bacterium]|nr:hypothetical protein [Betaproteobacteria bacterium]
MLRGIHLTLLLGPVVPVPAPRPVVDALESVEVTNAAGRASGFQLRFSLSNRSPLQTIFLLAGGETPLLRVMLVVTLNGTPEVLMDGVMTHTEVTQGTQPGQSTLTVTGDDLTRVMDLQDFGGLPYPAMSPEARVALIVAKYAAFGLVPMVVPSIFSETPIPTDRIPTHQGTDLAYVRELARLAGYVFYVEPGPAPGTNLAYWGPEVKVGPPQPALNVDMDHLTNVTGLDFSFDASKGVLPVVFIQNPLTRIPIPVPIPKLNPLQPPLGAIGTPVTRMTVLRDTAKQSPMAAISAGVAAAARSEDAVSANGGLDVSRYGRLLRPRRLVGVRGAGMAFDGLYFVDSVTTSLRRGECRQSFRLTRNGIVSLTPRVPP